MSPTVTADTPPRTRPLSAAAAPTLVALQTTVSPAEIEAARQTFERLVNAGPGALGGTTGGGSALTRALGTLGKGLGFVLATAGFWNAMARPAGIPVLQETLMLNGPTAFFDRLEQMLAENGGDLQAAEALRTAVTGYLERGDAHSAALVLREALVQLQEAGLIQPGADVTDLAVSAVTRELERRPPSLETPAPSPVPAPPSALPTSPAETAPALSAELATFRAAVARGEHANGEAAYARGLAELDALVAQVNEARANGTVTITDVALDVARVELDARRYHSVLAQYERNAASGGPLPSEADLGAWFDAVWEFDARVLNDHGEAAFGGDVLNASETRLTAAAGFRERFGTFATDVASGRYANASDAYADGLARLETFRLESNYLAGTLGVQGLDQRGYDLTLVQLEGRRLNSQLAQGVRDANAGRSVDVPSMRVLIERAGEVDARAVELGGDPLFETGALDVYREAADVIDATQRPLSAPDPRLEPEPDPEEPSLPPLEPLPETTLPGGSDVERVAEEYGVAPADIRRVMEQNPGMSAEQAAQYLRGSLLAAPTGGNQPALPPAPPDDVDGTVVGSGETPDGDADETVATIEGGDVPRLGETLSTDGAITQLNLEEVEDIGFRTGTDRDGTTVLFFEFTGPAADVERAKWEAGGYAINDHRNERGEWITYVTDTATGELVAYAPNTRLANTADRVWSLVQHNAGQIRDPAKRESYVGTVKKAIDMLLDPFPEDGVRRAPGESIADKMRRLSEIERLEWERQVREGAGEERPGTNPEDRIPPWER